MRQRRQEALVFLSRVFCRLFRSRQKEKEGLVRCVSTRYTPSGCRANKKRLAPGNRGRLHDKERGAKQKKSRHDIPPGSQEKEEQEEEEKEEGPAEGRLPALHSARVSCSLSRERKKLVFSFSSSSEFSTFFLPPSPERLGE